MNGFEKAYAYLKTNSKMLVRTEEGKAEVWETNECLLTIVDLNKQEFHTKRKQDNPVKYDLAKAELLLREAK